MISANGAWPLWAGLYSSRRVIQSGSLTVTNQETAGEIMGWLLLAPNTNAFSTNLAPSGTVTWIKTGGTNPASFMQGFTNQCEVIASRHLPPSPGQTNIYSFNTIKATVSGGGISSPFSASIILKTNHSFLMSLPLTNAFKATLTAKTGAAKGSFTNHPALGPKTVKWSGVLLQDYSIGSVGYGFFLVETNESGKIEFMTAP